MRKYALAAAVAVCGVGGTAEAAAPVTPVFTPNNFAVTNSSASVFETFNKTTVTTAGKAYSPATDGSGQMAEAVSGSVTLYPGGESQVGTAVNPDGTADNYIAIGSAASSGSFTVTFSAAMQYFSFALGSLDSYNAVQVFFQDGTNQTFSGMGIIGGANTPTGTAPVSYGNAGRASFNANGGSGFTSVIFSSSQAAFEIDDLAAAAPEPAAWALMIVGFGLAGSALRLRRRKTAVAFA